MKKVILFDMDGTLTESGEGIIKSVQYALEKMGKPEPEEIRLSWWAIKSMMSPAQEKPVFPAWLSPTDTGQ